MKLLNQLVRVISLFLVVMSGIGAVASAQKPSVQVMPEPKPILWEQVDVATQDLFLGPGGESNQPHLTSITFVSEQKGGYSTKYLIRDAAGKKWVAKVGAEAQSETASVRILSALGYKTEITYLVPKLSIPGKGDLTNVRLEARPDDVKRMETWSWRDNPFKGTREFQGLKIMMSFLNNWDMKEANNVILKRRDRVEYVVSDLGVSFGKTGSNGLPLFWRIGRSRNEPEHYSESEFIKNVQDGKITFNFNGKNDGSLGSVTREDGRWLADLLLQLTDTQIRDAFRAANYSDADINLLTQSVKSRIRALDIATQGTVGTLTENRN